MIADIVLWRDGGEAKTNIEQKIVYHSPSGMEWGYMGSGAADLALNILALFVGEKRALELHQYFKEDIVAEIPDEGGIIKAEDVLEWLDAATSRPIPPLSRQ